MTALDLGPSKKAAHRKAPVPMFPAVRTACQSGVSKFEYLAAKVASRTLATVKIKLSLQPVMHDLHT